MNTTTPKQPEAFNEAQRYARFVAEQGLAIKSEAPIFNASPSRQKKRSSKKPKNGRLWAW